MNLPEHLSISILHNEHKLSYMNVQDYLNDKMGWIKDHKDDANELDGWLNAESRQRAIDTNELWEFCVYPRTPVAFYVVYGYSFENCLEAANVSE